MKSRTLLSFVLAVDLSALIVLAVLPAGALGEQLTTLLLLVGLAALAGAHPVHIPTLRHEITASHPFIFLALATVGPLAAALVAMAGVVGAAVGRKGRLPLTIHLVFNLGTVVLSTVAASGAFLVAGGNPGQAVHTLIFPLVAATATYFIANSGLVAAVIALEKRQGLFSTWRTSFVWTATPFATGLTLAIAMLAVLETSMLWVLVLSLAPCWLMLMCYRAHANTLRLENTNRSP